MRCHAWWHVTSLNCCKYIINNLTVPHPQKCFCITNGRMRASACRVPDLQGQSCPGLTAGTIIALAGSVFNANGDTSCHYGGGHLPQITRYLALQTLRVYCVGQLYPPPPPQPFMQANINTGQKTGKNVKEWYETDDVIVNTNKKLSNWKRSFFSFDVYK